MGSTPCQSYLMKRVSQYGSLEIEDDGGVGPESVCVRFKHHRLGGRVLLDERMCGPLLRNLSDAARTDGSCDNLLLPPDELVWLVLLCLAILANFALCLFICILGTTWQRLRSAQLTLLLIA